MATNHDERPPGLPPHLTGWSWLSRQASGRGMGRAERSGVAVAVRIDPAGAESMAELAVLAEVRHGGLASLVEHGALPGGGRYVVRKWVPGEVLGTWVEGRSPGEVGRVVARACEGLEHLHRCGFVHGDLKHSNLIVPAGDDPSPVWTDFGLSTRADLDDGEVQGSWFHLAPDVLLGAPRSVSSDLFALGAMLHGLLIGPRHGAAEFHGRFPREDFFTAIGSKPEELPEWARDLVAGLVAHDPARRPRSAAQLGRILAGRLGIEDLTFEVEGELSWPVLHGRETWTRSLLGALSEEDDQAPHWVELAGGEDAGPVARELGLRLALDGAPVALLDLELELDGMQSTGQLDGWAGATAQRFRGRVLVAALEQASTWQGLAVSALALALATPAAAGPDAPRLVACGVGEPPLPRELWRRGRLQAPDPSELEAFLERSLELEDGDQCERLAGVLLDAAGGTERGLGAALAALGKHGLLLMGGERPRLRPGAMPSAADLIEVAARLPELHPDAECLLRAIEFCAGKESIDALLQLLGWAPERLPDAIAALDAAGLVEARLQAGTHVLVGRQRLHGAWAEGLAESTWLAWNRARVQHLERSDTPGESLWPHQLMLADVDEGELLESMRTLREHGHVERALELVRAVGRLQSARVGQPSARWSAERSSCLIALGQAQAALEIMSHLRVDPGPATQGLVERIDGEVCASRRDFPGALSHFERAAALAPEDGGHMQLARAQLAFDARDDQATIELVEGIRADGSLDSKLTPRVWNNLRALEAMARFRSGQIEAARSALTSQLDEARKEGNGPRVASLAINLATLERRAGDLAHGAELARRAGEIHAAAGNLASLAQAWALQAGILRDAGRPREAEALMSETLAVRLRLGDRAGAVAARGMLGLTLADRGHARPALVELARSSEELAEVGRSHDAMLLDARASEMRARLGLSRPSNDGSQGTLVAGDPRSTVALARSALLAGRKTEAQELARRGLDLSRRLGLLQVCDEADLVLALASEQHVEPPDGLGSPLAAQDRELIGRLLEAPLDEEATLELARTLEEHGRDDRAARAWIALSVRTLDAQRSLTCRRQAERTLEACMPGAEQGEREAQMLSLLAVPDPWPEDIAAWSKRDHGERELEAEVIELLDINRRLLMQEDLKTLLGTIVEHALQVSGAQRGFLLLAEGDTLAVDTALDSRRGGIAESEVELSGSALERALESMRPLRVSNAADDPVLGSAPSVVALDLRSILCVPFRVDDELRGVIYVDHRLREAAFDERVERVLGLLADQAGLAILQVRRMQQIRRLNRELGKRVVRVKTDLEVARRALSEANLPTVAGGIVGQSSAIQEVRRLIERAAASKLSVLVTGQSGTGKELAAHALHELSPRAEGPFVSENCAALPPSLIEAELFGARRGAYTGADQDREGLFERAHGGTLFLDEIGELPLEMQAKLLRVLETGEVRRLGSEQPLQVDFRLVVATNRDLEREIQGKGFRADLYYRLNGITVRMPDLAERAEDIPLLLEHFLRLQEEADSVKRKLSKPVLKRLISRPWPGNVRELANEVARLCLLSDGDLDDPSLVSVGTPPLSTPTPSSQGVTPLVDLERRAIEHALEVTAGDKTEAAKLLGISRAKVYQRVKEWS